MEACEELALALTRGLQLDIQRSSRDSLQCSSGYSTQTTTPCCSEDTIPSQGTRPGDAVCQSVPSLPIARSPRGAKELYAGSCRSLVCRQLGRGGQCCSWEVSSSVGCSLDLLTEQKPGLLRSGWTIFLRIARKGFLLKVLSF